MVVESLINYFLVFAAIGLNAAWAQNPIEDPPTVDPPPASLPEPTIPVLVPEPAFPAQVPEGVESTPLIPAVETSEVARVPMVDALERQFWECQLPSGSFAVGIPDIVTVSHHEYVIEGEARVYEATVTTRSALVARFYFQTPLPPRRDAMISPLLEGKQALDRVQTLIASGRHLQRVEADHGLPVKRAEDVALAPTVEYRLQNRKDVLALYQSAHDAWKNGEDGLFRLSEE